MPGKQLVVDACVGRSAGDKSQAPQSRHSRDALSAVRVMIDHKLVFNAALRKEWENHGSRFATSFLVYMFQRRRIRYVSDDAFVGLMRSCAHDFAHAETKVAFEKDAHVVAAALATDQIIVSNEIRLRAQLVQLGTKDSRIAALQWANPTTEGEACVLWLTNGAPVELERAIGFGITPP
jgi:hypothetical protein